MTALILFFLLSIGFSFLCSVLEAVLLSVTPGFIRKELDAGTATGKLLDQYKNDIDRPLSAILTLNTIAHTVGAIGVGAMAGDLFGANYLNLGPVSVSYESIIATVMTLAILIVSEIIPKTIGANNWRALSGFTATTIRILLWVLAPLVWISQLITRRLKKEKDRPVLTRSDIMRISLEGENSGVLEEHESMIIKNLLEFEKKTVRDIMTPRTVAFMVQEDTTVEEFMRMERATQFSRIPIFATDKDHITGFVLKSDVILANSDGRGQDALSLMKRDINRLDVDMDLPALFKLMTREQQHMYVVQDEFSNVLGLVTMEDMVEELFGLEIMDETDRIKDMQDYARRKSKAK